MRKFHCIGCVALASHLALACTTGNQASVHAPKVPLEKSTTTSADAGPAVEDQGASAREIAYGLAKVPGLISAHVTPLAKLNVSECGSPTGASVAFALDADDKISCVQNAGKWRCVAAYTPDPVWAARSACTADDNALIPPNEFARRFRERVPIGGFAVEGGPIDISEAHQSHLVIFAGEEFYVLAPSEGRWLVAEAPFRLDAHGPSLLTDFVELGEVGGNATVAVTRNSYEFPGRLNVGIWTMTVMQPAGNQWSTIATIPIGMRIEDPKLLLKIFLRPRAHDDDLELTVEESLLPVAAKAKLQEHGLWKRAMAIQGYSGTWSLKGDKLVQRR